jgi:hypothetical protein
VCSHYQAIKERARLERLGVAVPPLYEPPAQLHVFKGYAARKGAVWGNWAAQQKINRESFVMPA